MLLAALRAGSQNYYFFCSHAGNYKCCVHMQAVKVTCVHMEAITSVVFTCRQLQVLLVFTCR